MPLGSNRSGNGRSWTTTVTVTESSRARLLIVNRRASHDAAVVPSTATITANLAAPFHARRTALRDRLGSGQHRLVSMIRTPVRF
ncbi:hypothetical protein DVS28_a1934 [Euzebya pacifica]|uniref:Uncharacterized protein n=1 Tax=Euzebya pacifica TaxID=1608957 RepID=A0A346XWM2_9ACTN|nr:hypothetical protein DVS28_a1934 [Euzebya pacifica]